MPCADWSRSRAAPCRGWHRCDRPEFNLPIKATATRCRNNTESKEVAGLKKNEPETYRSAELFIDRGLKSDDSLFTPGKQIWTLGALDDLYQRYNGQPDTGSDRFDVKLRRQLAEAPDSTIQLMAEAIFVQYLVVDDIGGKSKRSLVEQVLSWMASPVNVPSDLDKAFDHGLAAGGLAFKTLRPFQIQFLVEFGRVWKGLLPDDRGQALADPWRFKAILWQVPINSGFAQREALLHLVFPHIFEDIVSREHKTQIAAAFANLISEPTDDVDRRLLQIREQLQKGQATPVSFYDPEIWHQWNAVASDPRRWDEFVGWARRFYEMQNFDENERTYKLRAAEQVRAARDALLARRPEWVDTLRDSFKHQNLTRWQAQDALLSWTAEHTKDAEDALDSLWSDSLPFFERLRGFVDHLPPDLLSGSDLLRVMSYLLMGDDATQFPPLTASVLKKVCELTGYPPAAAASDEARRYRHGLIFFDRLMRESKTRDLLLRDRLDAQSVAWAVASYPPPDSWSEVDKTNFLVWRDGAAPVTTVVEGVHLPVEQPGPLPPSRSLQQLADELFLPEDFLSGVVALLRERKQVIIYGPPGTGKTYVARALAEYLAPQEALREMVQFHPSYSYEDFVEGFRPKVEDGTMTYVLRHGPLRRLAGRAIERPKDEHILIIDEINRGNLPRILGELLFALEYRGKPIRLMYGDEQDRLVLPANLLILGTMNTADRSIGLIDAALRRRFHFVPLFPGEGPLADLLPQWLDKYKPEMREVAGIVNRLNRRLRERVGRHLQVGHSYFLRDDLSQEVLARIWENDIMPFLEDQLFGKEEDLAEFRLERLRRTGGADDSDDHPEGARVDVMPALQD
jgi:5-methylcytosine-specific restriction enzyme B